ncbi:hypothetical protein EUGRSUZ_G01065 [Eucalyptus grandis]|uniref:Uncharacterized protein n=2 Tax=Eucalyptus grandis TaxID=71139 RepID=A0A059BCQ5_EUCGR|nr:hypothetical protein EUGRSUZ_G01065 [Eucalyptus grandis]
MPDLRRTITDCTKISMVPPLYGQTCSSVNAHAMVENWQTPTIETLHGQTSSLQNKNAMEDVRNYCKGEQPRLEKLRKEDLAARNIKSVNNPLDESIAIAKHDQASRLHKGSILEENWLTSTNKSLDGVLKGKKGCTESELDGWEIVSAKQTEHPKKAGNAGISCKYKDPRLEKLKMPEFSAREISNQMVHLWSNRRPDQREESNEHCEETEPAREISISATPLTGSTSNDAEISANSSAFKFTKRFMPW